MEIGAMSLLDLALKIEEHVPGTFTAPVCDAQVTIVWTVQGPDRIPYRFPIRAAPGWYHIRPTSKTRAHIEKEAGPREILSYLGNLPRIFVIAVHRLGPGTWLCVPHNISDGAQRGWMCGEPKPIHLVRHTIQPFDVLQARMMADTLLYDGIDMRLGESWVGHMLRSDFENAPVPFAYRQAVALYRDALEMQRRREQLLAIEKRRATTEGQIEYALQFMGADLVDWNEAGEQYIVRWMHDGHEYGMHVRRDMRIHSAGICLAGRDTRQDLASIVAVMEEARGRRSRWDDDDW